MVNSLNSIKEQLNHYWANLEKHQKRNIIIVVSLVVLAIIVVSVIMSQKNYMVLYSSLDDKEAAEVFTKLEELGAEPKLEGTSTILVPEDKEPQLRMQMTMEGYPKSGFNYDIYLQSGSLGQTDDEMQKRWIIQLQERLGQSIRFLNGVEDAVVTIAMPETDSFVLKNNEIPVTASVIVLPAQDYEISFEQAKSIEQLVEKSVPGLDAENISIIDNKMNVLNTDLPDQSQLLNNQFELQQQLENKLKSQVKDLLEPVFGYGSVEAAVNVKLNFDTKVQESVTFEPVADDSGIIVSQELLKEKVNNTYSGGVPGEATNVTEYPEAVMGEGSSSEKHEERINYEINEIKERIEEEKGKIEELSIAVVINNDGLDPQTLDQVKELVAMSIGTDVTRVAVQNWEFNTDLQDDIMEAFEDRRQSQEGTLSLSTILLIIIGAIIIVLIGVFSLVQRNKRKELMESDEQETDDILAIQEEQGVDLELIEERNQVKKQLDKFVTEQPEAIAQLLRNWISED